MTHFFLTYIKNYKYLTFTPDTSTTFTISFWCFRFLNFSGGKFSVDYVLRRYYALYIYFHIMWMGGRSSTFVLKYHKSYSSQSTHIWVTGIKPRSTLSHRYIWCLIIFYTRFFWSVETIYFAIIKAFGWDIWCFWSRTCDRSIHIWCCFIFGR